MIEMEKDISVDKVLLILSIIACGLNILQQISLLFEVNECIYVSIGTIITQIYLVSSN